MDVKGLFAVDIGVDVPVAYDLVCSTEQISYLSLKSKRGE